MCASAYSSATSIARRWHSYMRAWVSRSASAHATLTDFWGEKVRSNAATGGLKFAERARSCVSISATLAARSSSSRPSGSRASRRATRSDSGAGSALGLRPHGSPDTGSTHRPSMLPSWSAVTSEPAASPAPPFTPASPAPIHTPGGVPEDS